MATALQHEVTVPAPNPSAQRHGDSSRALGKAEAPGTRPAGSMETEWITEDLVARTQDVWGLHLGRQVDRDEAIEMLLNVQGVAMAFHLASIESETS
ncbi:MAG: hypothetical protein GXP25_13290 [Planctomycetes bacterium]|nr:hypothetical protein [Planctomycetota bacterium]